MPKGTSRAGHTYLDEANGYVDANGRRVGTPVKDYAGNEKIYEDSTFDDRASYGGSRQAAEDEANRLDKQGAWYDNAKFTNFDRTDVRAAHQQELQSRGEQLYGVRAAADLAGGAGPSAARAQFGAGVEANIAAAAAGGGQARYGAGNMQVVGGLANARGGELAAANAAHLDGASGLRGADIGMGRTSTGQNQAAAGIFYRERGLKDQMASYYADQGRDARLAQMQAENFNDAGTRRRNAQEDRFYAEVEKRRNEEGAQAAQTAAALVGTVAKASDLGLKQYIGRMR